MEFYGKSFPEAVQLLTGESGEGQTEATTAPPAEFHLPLHNRTVDRAIQYLCESRGLNKSLVETFLLSGDIYEDSKRHNVVFVGRDRSGTPRYAHVRGTQESFRQDIAGSDKSYPFRYEGNGSQLFVFEAPIDLLSFICPVSYTHLVDTNIQTFLRKLGVAHLRPCFTPMFQRFGTAPVGSGNGIENILAVLVSDTISVLVQLVHSSLL